MPESRAPEEMPTEWRVKEFSRERGFGTLAHASGEEIVFNIDVWDLGGWKPSRQEESAQGPASATMPREGEPVRVRWKRSFSGKTVPALVQPSGRTARRRYQLGAWLKAIQRAGRFAGLTTSALLKTLAKLDEDRAQQWRDREPRDANDFAFLLMDLAHVREVDARWASRHAAWLYSDDHDWDRDRAREILPAMLGLVSAPDSSGASSLSDYVANCNAVGSRAAAARALPRGGRARVRGAESSCPRDTGRSGPAPDRSALTHPLARRAGPLAARLDPRGTTHPGCAGCDPMDRALHHPGPLRDHDRVTSSVDVSPRSHVAIRGGGSRC